MSHLLSPQLRGPDHRRLITWLSLVLVTLGYFCGVARAQTAVVLAPVPQLQFFDQSGRPLAFGCVFTYQVASVNPLSSYTDYSGTTLNQNPVILSAGGSANIWLQAGLAYTFRVKAAGGTNCASGSTLYTVDGIGGGSTVLTTNVPFSSTPIFVDAAQIQLFLLTLTGNATAQPMSFVGVTPPGIIYFQISQDGTGGHSFSWPANTIGGCTIGASAGQVTTQEFMYDGANATAVGPCVVGNGPAINFGAGAGSSLVLATTLQVAGFSLFNGGFGCVEGGVVGGIALDDVLWCDSVTHRLNFNNNNGGQDQVVGAKSTDTFTNKTFDTAGAGNVLKINGNQESAATGTGGSSQTAVLNGNPTLAGWNCAITTKTTTYTLLGSDCILQASASGGSFTITLPHAIVGQDWEITRTDATAHTLTIAGDSGNVNNAASITLQSGGSLRCHADGTNSWCHTSPGGISLLTQTTTALSASGTGSFTFTYPIPYSVAPACFCTATSSGDGGIGGCNISGVPSVTACRVNVGDSGTGVYVVVIGQP